MAKERIINTKFWDDNYIVTLDPIEKLMYLYFLTNPLTNISGIYEIPLKTMGFDTGIDPDMVKRVLMRFERDGKVFYRSGWIGIVNFIKNQHIESESVKIGIMRELNLAPEEIKEATLGRGYREGGGRVGGVSNILNLTKLNLSAAPPKAETDISDSDISYLPEDEEPAKKKPQNKAYEAALVFMAKRREELTGKPFKFEGSRIACYAALKALKKLMPNRRTFEIWEDLCEDKFWQEKGFDLWTIKSQFLKKGE